MVTTAHGPSGLLVVDKPKGPTSHDVVAMARRHLKTRRVGHAGTLDPMATGVLVLLVGEATKLSSYLTAQDKHYEAVVQLGVGTDSFDADGQITEVRSLAPGWLDAEILEQAVTLERERTEQVPPAVSAIKLAGRRSHQLARSGVVPSHAPRPVRVANIEIVALEHGLVRLRLEVSKGYYVRSFARDLGDRLGVPAHLTELRRTQSGCFSLDAATRWPPTDDVRLVELAVALEQCMPTAQLTADGVRDAGHGKKLTSAHFVTEPPNPGVCGWLDGEGSPVALGERDESGYRVLRGFRLADEALPGEIC